MENTTEDKSVKIKQVLFSKLFDQQKLNQAVCDISGKINQHYLSILQKNPNDQVLAICVLKGAFMFFSDLVKKLQFPHTVQFVVTSSYSGLSSTGKVKFSLEVQPQKIKNKHILLVDDILETGTTLRAIVAKLKESQPKTIQVCTLLKHMGKNSDFPLLSYGLKFNQFIIGYGIDFDEQGRSLGEIYQRKL